MESGDDGLESEANVRPRPCLTGAGSPGAQSTATDRGPSRQARLNRSAEGARTACSARHTCPKTPETQSRNRSVRQAARPHRISDMAYARLNGSDLTCRHGVDFTARRTINVFVSVFVIAGRVAG